MVVPLNRRNKVLTPDGVRSLVDSRFGPIRAISHFRMGNQDPPWWVYICEFSRMPAGNWFEAYPAGAAGVSLHEQEAKYRAMGEAIERYGALNATLQTIVGPLSESVLADRLPKCAASENCCSSFKEIDRDTVVTHTTVQRLDNCQNVLIPLACADLKPRVRESEPLVALPISTGLAFDCEQTMAIWRGICEVAERDAMMIMWWLQTAIPEIVVDEQAPEGIVARLRRLEGIACRVRLFDMTTDFRVPSVFCVLQQQGYPFVTVGAACREDPAGACNKAIDEAVAARVMLSGRRQHLRADQVTQFEWVRNLEQHVYLYADPRMAPALTFLLGRHRAPVTFTQFAQQEWWSAPQNVVEMSVFARDMAARGFTLLWKPVTAAETEDLGHVVKCIIPEMIPLSQDHNVRWLATPRLLSHAALKLPRLEAFNPYPHPFA